ncbi:MAG: hypothetical protein ACLS6G_02735 [Christensenellales bacterium]
MGYSERSVLLSAHGLVSVGALLLPLRPRCCWRALKAARENQATCALRRADAGDERGDHGAVVRAAGRLYLNRYWIPLMTLGAPVMAACLTAKRTRRSGACALLFAGVVLTPPRCRSRAR